jgi:osmotically-inducible protein OsmY
MERKNVKRAWRATVSVNVRDGVVDLSGTIRSEGEREALKVAVENVPGIDPTNGPSRRETGIHWH